MTGCEDDLIAHGGCAAPVVARYEAMRDAGATLEEAAQEVVGEVGAACSAIGRGFGDDLPAAPTEPAEVEVAEIEAVCARAAEALAAEGVSVTASGGGCVADEAQREMCSLRCRGEEAFVPGCEEGCDALSRVAAACTPPHVVVEGDDPAMVAMLEAQLPVLLQLGERADLEASGDALADHVERAAESIASIPGCNLEVGEGAGRDPRAEAERARDAAVALGAMVEASRGVAAVVGG